MKNFVVILGIGIVLLGGAFYLLSSDNEKELATSKIGAASEMSQESTETMEPGRYTADTNASVVTWQAGKPAIVGYVHTGTFSLQSGEIELSNESLTGEFVLDMDSIKLTSLGGGKAGQESMLEGHLKAEGFFDIESYPTATFRIVDVSPKVLPGPDQSEYTATGELTLKGQTNSLSFPMRVVVNNDNEVWMYASLTIDRTLWGVNAGSASVADRITDNIIGDDVEIDIEMKLVK
ncbi:MAG: YceI family protein [Candidatus Paceibacterota bacterium]